MLTLLIMEMSGKDESADQDNSMMMILETILERGAWS